jgi:hypothetical protein
MSYTVVWETPACFEQIDDLTALGIPSNTIKNAVQVISEELMTDPASKGVALSEGLRKMNLPPFRAYFSVDEPKKRVTVTVLHWQP